MIRVQPFQPEIDWDHANGREKHIGASEMSKVVGLSKYGTVRTVALEKLGLKQPDESSEHTEWGCLVESTIAKRWAARQGVSIRRVPRTFHKTCRIAATPDYRIVGTKALLQVKTASEFAKGYGTWNPRKPIATDELPPGYIVQAQAEMSCFPRIHMVVFAVECGAILKTYVVTRCDPLIGIIERVSDKFWEIVDGGGVPQEIDFYPGALKSVDEDFNPPPMRCTEDVLYVLSTLPGEKPYIKISAEEAG